MPNVSNANNPPAPSASKDFPAVSPIVVVGPVTLDGFGTLANPIGEEESIFTDYLVNSIYEEDGHTYMMGVTSPEGFEGDDAAFVQLTKKTLIWIADWTAARFNEPPPIPCWNVEGWMLLDKQFEKAAITFPGDLTTPLYRISGTYFFGKRKLNPDVLKDMVFPYRPDFTPSGAVPRHMPQSKVIKGIITSTFGDCFGSGTGTGPSGNDGQGFDPKPVFPGNQPPYPGPIG